MEYIDISTQILPTMKKAILIFFIILNMNYASAYSETILDPVSSTFFFPLFNKDCFCISILFLTGQNYANNKAWNSNDTNSLHVIWLEAEAAYH